MVTVLLLLLGGLILCAGMALLTDSIASNLFRPEAPETGYLHAETPQSL